jgi:hypothetical protein
MSNKPNTVDIQAINQNISEQLNNIRNNDIKLPLKAEDFKAVADQELNIPQNETMQVGLEAENTQEHFSLTGSIMSLLKEPLVLVILFNLLMNRKVKNMVLGMIPMTKDSDNQYMKNLMLSLILTGLFIVLKKFI